MRLKKNDDSYLELKSNDYKQDILINYKLVEASGNNFISVDRGVLTHRYSSTITFRQQKDIIREIVREITLLRTNGKEVILDEFDENIFGDNIDHSGSISCVVNMFGKETSPALNVQTIELTFLPIDLSFVGTTELPASLSCLNHKWKGYSDWNTHINETYNRSNYFIDREADTFTFEGDYILTIEDNQNLLTFWKTQRGSSFIIDDGDFGTEYMFGEDAGTGQHTVIITDVSYSRFSPISRLVTIKLVKV